MTVVLNPAAIEALFVKPTVLAFMEKAANEEVIPKMAEDIRSYFVNADTTVEDDLAVRVEGTQVIAGLRDDPDHRSSRSNLRRESKSARYARVGEWGETRKAFAGGS